MKETKNIAYKFRLKLNPHQEKTLTEWCRTARYIYNTVLGYSEKRYEIFRKHHSYSISLCPIGDKEELKKSKKRYRESLKILSNHDKKISNAENCQNPPKEFHKMPQFNAFATAKEFTELNKIIEPIRKQRVFENSIKGFYKYKNEEEIISYLQKIKEKIKKRPYLSQFFDLLVFLEKKEKDQQTENPSEKLEFLQKLKEMDFKKFLDEIKKYFANPRIEESEYDSLTFLKDIPKNCVTHVLIHLETAYKNFYEGLKQGRKVGTPNYKKRNSKNSISISDNGSEIDIKLLEKDKSQDSENFKKGIRKVRLIKIGAIKFIQHKPILGKIKNVTVSKEFKDWYISFCCEVPIESLKIQNKPKAGMDLGIAKTIVLADENDHSEIYQIDLEKIEKLEKKVDILKTRLKAKISYGRQKEILAQIKKFQTELKNSPEPDRKKNLEKKLERLKNELEQFYPSDLRKKAAPSKNYLKIQEKIRKLHVQIRNIRRDFLHKKSYEITNKYGYIAKENLQIKNMSKSAKGTEEEKGKNVGQKSGLNRSILRQGWGMFETMLEYKGEWYGCEIQKVDPKNTSRKCQKCGHTSSENRKNQEEFKCEKCGFWENADINAAKNILQRGLEEKEKKKNDD